MCGKRLQMLNEWFFERIPTYEKLSFAVSVWCGCLCFVPLESGWKAHQRILFPSELFHLWLTVISKPHKDDPEVREKMTLAEHPSVLHHAQSIVHKKKESCSYTSPECSLSFLTICASRRLPRAVFHSPHWTSSWKNSSNHFQTEGLHCLKVTLKKVLYKETQLLICSPFATSDFKGLCSILLPPFISPPVWSAPSYSAVPQMEVFAELWSPLSPFPDLCKFSYSALSCSRLWGGAGLFCS